MPYGYRSKLGTPIIRWLKLNIVGPQSTAMAPDHPRHYPPQQPGSCRKAPQTGEDSDASWVFFGTSWGDFMGKPSIFIWRTGFKPLDLCGCHTKIVGIYGCSSPKSYGIVGVDLSPYGQNGPRFRCCLFVISYCYCMIQKKFSCIGHALFC